VGLDTRLVVVRDDDGEILGGAQLVLKRLWAGVAVGGVAYGPLVRSGVANVAGLVVDRLLADARSAGVRLIVVQPAEGAGAVEEALASRGFETGCPGIAPEATLRLDLTRTEGELLAGMRKQRQRNLRRPGLAEIEVREDDDVDTFQRLHAATAARQGFTALSRATLRAQWDALAPLGMCSIVLARHRGEPVSGMWLSSFAGTVTYRLAGWDAEATARLGTPKGTNEAMHWTLIRQARSRGATTYDLGGVDRALAERHAAGGGFPEDFARTAAHFKYGFGGAEVLLPRARWALTGRGAAVLGRPLARRLLTSGRTRALMARARNG
jgi:hypothetical protein